MRTQGIITQLLKKDGIVDVDGRSLEAAVRGVLHHKGRPQVGDHVDVEIDQTGANASRIVKIHNRRNLLHRPSIANVDQVLLVVSLRSPELDLLTLDRCLFTAEVNDIRTTIVWNKIDLLDSDGIASLVAFEKAYHEIGYQSLRVSALTGEGIERVRAQCAGHISCLSGLSGVGKSTILSHIFPEIQFRTSEVSVGSQRGVHTTTSTVLLRLEGGGYIADTPGFSLIEVPPVPADSVVSSFPDLVRYLGHCQFGDCTHRTEPGCSVRGALGEGKIQSWRHVHFVRFYEEMKQRWRGARPDQARPKRPRKYEPTVEEEMAERDAGED